MKDFLTKKLLEEYLPDNSNFILMFDLPDPSESFSKMWPRLRTYCRWFDTMRKANEHGAHRREVYGEAYITRRVKLSFDNKADIYIAFDMSNGDKSSKRYCWLFNSRKAAQEHIKNQHANNGARLSVPHKIKLL